MSGSSSPAQAKSKPAADKDALGKLIAISSLRAVLELSVEEWGHLADIHPADFVGIGDRQGAFILQVTELRLSGSRADTCVMEGRIVGQMNFSPRPVFKSGSSALPALQSSAFLLTDDEVSSIINPAPAGEDAVLLSLGDEVRTQKAVEINVDKLLERHIAVLGSSGSGKSCFAAAVLQQLVELKNSRIVIFDVNGEYPEAFAHCPPEIIDVVTLGREEVSEDLDEDEEDRKPTPFPERQMRIPYYSLGRSGLMRLLQPAEMAQRPALDFALDHLHYIDWDPEEAGAMLVGEPSASFFDDCRQTNANETHNSLEELRYGLKRVNSEWPHMLAMSALIADSYCLEMGRSGWGRSSELYSHISPLINRIHRLVEDPRFRTIIDVQGGLAYSDERMNFAKCGDKLVEEVFGNAEEAEPWRVKIVNLQAVPHDLLPLILDALLGQLSQVAFQRGPGQTHPTLLVLEEAHHYLMQDRGGSASDALLAYERLAKEGRKFGLSLWISTQRPAEVSPTVLSQCGNWAVFRLVSDVDLKQVETASEWLNAATAGLISSLPQRELLAFGNAIPVPMRLRAVEADPLPASGNPEFGGKWGGN